MATDNARSALNKAHHQFEYDPPGEEVTTSSVMPMACDKPSWSLLKIMTAVKPSSGMMRNCMNKPVIMAALFDSCAESDRTDTVAARPKTRKKRNKLDRMIAVAVGDAGDAPSSSWTSLSMFMLVMLSNDNMISEQRVPNESERYFSGVVR